MHEGDLQTEKTLPRLGIDQLRAGRCELGERRCDIVHLIGDVVHPRASLCQEPTDRRVVAESGKKLDPALAHTHRRGLDSLLLDAGPMLEPAAEEALVRPHGLVEVRDCNPDVMDAAGDHGRDSSVRNPR